MKTILMTIMLMMIFKYRRHCCLLKAAVLKEKNFLRSFCLLVVLVCMYVCPEFPPLYFGLVLFYSQITYIFYVTNTWQLLSLYLFWILKLKSFSGSEGSAINNGIQIFQSNCCLWIPNTLRKVKLNICNKKY